MHFGRYSSMREEHWLYPSQRGNAGPTCSDKNAAMRERMMPVSQQDHVDTIVFWRGDVSITRDAPVQQPTASMRFETDYPQHITLRLKGGPDHELDALRPVAAPASIVAPRAPDVPQDWLPAAEPMLTFWSAWIQGLLVGRGCGGSVLDPAMSAARGAARGIRRRWTCVRGDLALGALVAHVPGVPAAQAASPPPVAIGVDGTSMTLNGAPWLPRGVQISGFESTLAFACDPSNHFYQTCIAQENYRLAELNAARQFGADTLRFQVSQPSLDSQSPLYDKSYVQATLSAIALARSQGFAVVIMIQDEPISGEPPQNETPLPNAETVRDWDMLAGAFAHDRGVMFELFNEPMLDAGAGNWTLWANGGEVVWGPPGVNPRQIVAVSMQPLINRLRSNGSENVIVLDGLEVAHTLDGVPPIEDRLHRVVYAVHPYFDGMDKEWLWDTEFGNASQTPPVFADEWSAPSESKLGLGKPGTSARCLATYQESVDFLNYIRTHHIPLAGGAFDVVGWMVTNVPGWSPSNYDNYSPSVPHDDAGLLVHTLFETNYGRPVTAADGVTH